jgi:ribosomal protein S18 acetylase RimI-like enzyme
MYKASYTDKPLVTQILTKAFDTNNSVNYTVKQDEKRKERIKKLMEYSFDVCYLFGAVYLSDDKKACALILFPDNKKTTLKTLLLDAQLALQVIGLTRIKRVLDRESRIHSGYPAGQPIFYVWFLGVDTAYQGKGIGKALLGELIKKSKELKRPLYLETSMPENVPFYLKSGFQVYNQLNFGHTLYCMRTSI